MPPEELARTIGRRKALQLIGMAMVAVACGPAESDAETSDQSGEPASQGDSGQADAPPSGSAGSGGESAAPTTSTTSDASAQVAPEFDADGALETVSVRERMMPADVVAQLAGVYGGVWLGSWSDSEGATGTIDANVGFDLENATLNIAVAASGPILGTDGLEPTSVSVPLGGDFFEFEERDPLGYVYVSNQGNEKEVIALHDPPAAPDLETLMIELSYGPDGNAIATYQAFHRDGSVITGSIVLAQGADRPEVPSV